MIFEDVAGGGTQILLEFILILVIIMGLNL